MDLVHANEKMHEMTMRNNELQALLLKSDNDADEGQAIIASMTLRIAELERLYTGALQCNSDGLRMLTQMKAATEAMEAELRARDAVLHAREAELRAKESELRNTRLHLEAAVNVYATAKVEYKRVSEQLSDATSTLGASDAEIRALRDELSAAKSEATALRAEIASTSRYDTSTRVTHAQAEHAAFLCEYLHACYLDKKGDSRRLIGLRAQHPLRQIKFLLHPDKHAQFLKHAAQEAFAGLPKA